MSSYRLWVFLKGHFSGFKDKTLSAYDWKRLELCLLFSNFHIYDQSAPTSTQSNQSSLVTNIMNGLSP